MVKEARISKYPIIKYLLAGLGLVSMVIGIINIFIPLLPTTPFLLLAAYLWAKSSRRLHKWLMTNSWTGKYLTDIQEKRGISLRTKLFAIISMWVSVLFSTLMLFTNPYIIGSIFVFCLFITYHIVRFPLLKEEKAIIKIEFEEVS